MPTKHSGGRLLLMMDKLMDSLPASIKGRLETAQVSLANARLLVETKRAEVEGAAKGLARRVLAPLNAAVAPKDGDSAST